MRPSRGESLTLRRRPAPRGPAAIAWAAALLALAALGCAGAAAPGGDARAPRPAAAADSGDEWGAYGRDAAGTRWSPLAQVTRENVARLAVAWTARTGEAGLPVADHDRFSLEATPVVVDGTMYVSTPLGRVLALDPATGARRWTYDPGLDQKLRFGDFTNRGVTVWRDSAAAAGAPCARTVFVGVLDARLVALDAATGRPCPRFGVGGVVNLRHGLRNAPAFTEEYELTSPPVVVNGVVVVGSAVADNGRVAAPSGEVRGFDARTGALRWSWDPVPQDPRDPAWPTWEGPGAHRAGAANAWSVLAADPERDLVFVPTASPSPDYYGGERPGDNRYANSVVALRASTGRVVWHFQTVHHDLWDYDNAPPPALVTLRRDGRELPVVLQATKTGSCSCCTARRANRCSRSRNGRCRRATWPASGRRCAALQCAAAARAGAPRRGRRVGPHRRRPCGLPPRGGCATQRRDVHPAESARHPRGALERRGRALGRRRIRSRAPDRRGPREPARGGGAAAAARAVRQQPGARPSRRTLGRRLGVRAHGRNAVRHAAAHPPRAERAAVHAAPVRRARGDQPRDGARALGGPARHDARPGPRGDDRGAGGRRRLAEPRRPDRHRRGRGVRRRRGGPRAPRLRRRDGARALARGAPGGGERRPR
jgi:outer membrane protein assembly factor BamB